MAILSLMNTRYKLHAKLIRSIVFTHDNSSEMWSKKYFKYKFSILKTIRDWVCIYRRSKERNHQLNMIHSAYNETQDQLNISHIREELNKLKACCSVLMNQYKDQDRMMVDIERVYLHKKTIWDMSDKYQMKVKQDEEKVLLKQIKSYRELFTLKQPDEYNTKNFDYETVL